MPIWISYVQALGPTFVALVAAVIASAIQYRQWKTARDKLRLDLFDRRAKVFEAITKRLGFRSDELDEFRREIVEIIDNTESYKFLFPEAIAIKIMNARELLLMIGDRSLMPEDHLIMDMLDDYSKMVNAMRLELVLYLRFTT